ncbi:MAG: hypothetical protein ABWZ82_03895, partial [Candidatus Limnocylindrales bacterium]
LLGALPAAAQPTSAAPVASGEPALVRLTARPLLGGHVRPGSWVGVQVHLENDGPAVLGELRLTGGAQQGSRYSVEVELPTGARQDHLLYTQPSWAGGRLTASLVSDAATLVEQRMNLTSMEAYTTNVFVVAERPEAIAPGVRGIATAQGQVLARVVTIAPEDLPPRAEAWAVIDRLVWQDVDPARLTREQLDALTTWVGAGGRLVVVGGQAGLAGVDGLPEDLLPYVPASTIDVPASDLQPLVGALPTGTAPVPALTGDLVRGSVTAWSDGRPIAAQVPVGQGQVVVLGIDPSTPSVAGAPGVSGMWRQAIGPLSGQALNPLVLQDDNQIVAALNSLPAVALPDLGLLFGLLAVYIALIGPINYLVLRRIDRREWAWVTMPVLVLVFGVGTYVVGMGLKGTDVIVDQLAIVRAAAGTDRGIAQAYVGIFSPNRRTFDVTVGDDALLANPNYMAMGGSGGTPLDVVGGESSRLRGYEVGFGVMRAFRAEAPVESPQVDADLTYRDGVLEGTLTNRSEEALESVAVTWGGQATLIPTLAPGETADVRLDLGGRLSRTERLATMVIPTAAPGDTTALVRRAVLDQVTGYRNTLGTGGLQANPVIIAFRPGPTLDVGTGSPARQEGDTLYLMPAATALDGKVILTDPLIARSTLEIHTNEVWEESGSWSLGSGWLTAELRPMVALDGAVPTYLGLTIGQDGSRLLTGRGLDVEPLSADRQPAQDDPMILPTTEGEEPPPEGGVPVQGIDTQVPAFQLLDHTTGLWVEFEAPMSGREMRIVSPERYLDGAGAVRIRFINRMPDQGVWFTLSARIEAMA